MTPTPMTPDAALTRLRQYGERTSTWSTATYNDGTEKTLHEIALTLAAEVKQWRATFGAEALPDALAEMNRLRERNAELEAAANCPSRATTSLVTSECALPVRHRGDHRNAAKNHYWDDEYAAAQGSPEPEVTP